MSTYTMTFEIGAPRWVATPDDIDRLADLFDEAKTVYAVAIGLDLPTGTVSLTLCADGDDPMETCGRAGTEIGLIFRQAGLPRPDSITATVSADADDREPEPARELVTA